MNCDKETGTCSLEDFPAELTPYSSTNPASPEISFYYFGDPMCSWCWGGSETFSALEKLCAEYNLAFNVITGGLRSGGGDPWDEGFRNFLRSEWQHISEKTGKSFSSKLFERSHFEYDTEPACRAVNTAREFLEHSQIYSFFKSVQQKFYVMGDDPKEKEFYKSICEEYSIPFNEFIRAFEDKKTRAETIKQFMLCREWGIRSFPTVCFQHNGTIYPFINGYISPDKVSDLLKDKALHLIKRG